MEKINQRVACKAIIWHSSKVLILREAPTYADGTNIGTYQLPGGRIERGEKFMVGLAREVAEETGLQVEVGKPFFVSEWFPKIRGEQNHIIAIFFACTATTNQVRLSDEHDAYEWINPVAYKKYNLTSPEDEVFREYLKTLA